MLGVLYSILIWLLLALGKFGLLGREGRMNSSSMKAQKSPLQFEGCVLCALGTRKNLQDTGRQHAARGTCSNPWVP